MASPPSLQHGIAMPFRDPLAAPDDDIPLAMVIRHPNLGNYTPDTTLWPKAAPYEANQVLSAAADAQGIRQQEALAALAEEIERSTKLQQERRQTRQRRCVICGGLIILVVVGFISGIVVGFVAFGRKRRQTQQQLPISPNSTAFDSGLGKHWIALIQSHIPSVVDFVDDTSSSSSPQHRALVWMLDDPYTQEIENDDEVLQRYALATLAFSCLDDPVSWIENGSDELPSGSECRWEGVECRVLTRIVEAVNLDKSGLSGSVPANELALLSHLTSLRLGNNYIEGTLPTMIGDWSKTMKTLDLQNNDLVGTLPSEIGHLTSLLSINLNGNQMEASLPSEIGNFRQLVLLDLSNNRFTGAFPPQTSRLSNLDVLYLYENDLTGTIPPQRCRNIQMAKVECSKLRCECCVQGYANGTSGAAC